MPITITKDHYQLLYTEKFSDRGLSVLTQIENQSEGPQKEKLKAAFCADIFLRFNVDTATQDDFKDMMLALKFVIEKNISSGIFLTGYIDNTQFLSGLMHREKPLTPDDLADYRFVSSMILISSGGKREIDIKEEIHKNSPLKEIDHLMLNAIDYVISLNTIFVSSAPPAGGTETVQEKKNRIDLLNVSKNNLNWSCPLKRYHPNFQIMPISFP